MNILSSAAKVFLTFLSSRVNKKRSWKHIEYFDESWKRRIKEMAQLIPENARSVLDVGCGRSWLREFIDQDLEYYGVDYKKRDSHTLVCDLNSRQFPNIKVDVVFCSGILEYIEEENLDWFFERIKEASPILLLSYCTLDLNSDFRSRVSMCWKNHFYRSDLVRYVEQLGFSLLWESEQPIDGNHVFKFHRKKI